MVVVFDGSTEDFWSKMAEVVERVVMTQEQKKLVPIEKRQACKMLEISYPTLKKIMDSEKITTIYTSDIERLKLKYPKFKRK